MLGLSVRAARATWTVLLLIGMIALIYKIGETVILFMSALFFAYVLSPAVSAMERVTPRVVGRTTSVTVVYLLFLGLLAGLAATFGASLVDQATSFAQRIPDLIKNREWLEQTVPGWLGPAKERIIDWVQLQTSSGGAALVPFLKNAPMALKGTLTGALYFVLVPILAFFFIKDGPEMREYILSVIGDGQRRELLDDILSDIHTMLGHYIRALVTLSAISIAVYSMFFSIIGLPYSVLVAFQAAVLEFIPVIGPLIAGVVMLLVAGFSGFGHLLVIVIFWLIYRGIQDYILSPNLMGKGVEIHPLLILFGVLAGEQVGGVPGMIFSVPVIAMVRLIFVRARRAAERRRLAPVQIEPS